MRRLVRRHTSDDTNHSYTGPDDMLKPCPPIYLSLCSSPVAAGVALYLGESKSSDCMYVCVFI